MSNKVISVLFIGVVAAFFIIMFVFMTQSLGSTDMGVNLTGTVYHSAYNGSVNTSKAGVAFLSYAPPILGVAALVAVLFLVLAVAKVKS